MYLFWTSVCTICIKSPDFTYFTFPKSVLGGSETWESKGQALEWKSFIIQILGITFLNFHISTLWFMFNIFLFLLGCSPQLSPSGSAHFLNKPFLKILVHTSYFSAMEAGLYALQNVPVNLQTVLENQPWLTIITVKTTLSSIMQSVYPFPFLWLISRVGILS